LARKALTQEFSEPVAVENSDFPFVLKDGWYVLPRRGGFVTNALVKKLQEELDEEEARQKGGY
jgi:hypothetical protein